MDDNMNFNHGYDSGEETAECAYDNAENITDNYQPAETFGDSVSGVDAAPKKNKGALIGGICAGALAVVVGGSAIAYAASDYVKNQVKLRFSSPENYFAWVSEKNAENAAEEAEDAYEEYLDLRKDGYSSNMALQYKVSEDAKSMLLESMLGSDYESIDDDGTKEIVNVVNNIDSIELGFNAGMQNTDMKSDIYADLNGDTLASVEIGMKSDEMKMYARIPELKEDWLCIDLSGVKDQLGEDEKYFELLQDMSASPENYLSPSELSGIIEKYSTIIADELKSVEVRRNELVEIGDIKVEYTVATSDIDNVLARDIAKKYVSALSEDKVIKNLLVEKLDAVSESEYTDALNEALDELEELDGESEDKLSFATFIDPRGDIRGFQLYMEDIFDIKFAVGQKDDKIAAEINFSDFGDNKMNLQVNAEESGKKLSGTADVKVVADGEKSDFSVKFTDVEVVNEKYGYVNGNLEINLPDTPAVKLALESDGKAQNINYNINVDGTDFGTVSAKFSSTEDTKIKFDEKSSFTLDINDEEPDLSGYLSDEDLTKFVENLVKKIGLSDEYASLLADSFEDAFSGSADDYNYDDYSVLGEDDDDFAFIEDDDDDIEFDDDDLLGEIDWDSIDFEDEDFDWDAFYAELEEIDAE